MKVSFKICGLTDAFALEAAVTAGAAMVGFVHYPGSPRHISLQKAGLLTQGMPPGVASVCVLVDPDDELLEQVRTQMHPRYVQLHGNETPQRVAEIRSKFLDFSIIKAFRVRSADDIAAARAYTEVAELFLFDARAPEAPGALPGGNGISFDWTLLKGREFARPWLLSGGLNIDNAAQAIATTGAKMVDVSSGVERSPGVKDAALIHAFARALHV